MTAPDAKVVVKWMDKIQEAMDIQVKGLSAQKIMVSLYLALRLIQTQY